MYWPCITYVSIYIYTSPIEMPSFPDPQCHRVALGVHRPQAPQRQLVAPPDLGAGGLGKAAADAVEGPGKAAKKCGENR